MPAKVVSTPALPCLSRVGGKPVIARFDGGHLSSDGGLLVLREVERRLDVAGRLAACIMDPRDPERIVHGLDEIIRFRLLMIAAGYENGNDAGRLRTDPMFKLAMARLGDEAELCSQPTISRLENLPYTRALLRMGQTMVDLYCTSFRQVPRRIVLDVDDTFDAVHGAQQMRLFNAHYDEYGFQPIVVFDGEGRFVTAVLRPGQAAEWTRDPCFPAPPAAPASRQLAPGRNPATGRQPIARQLGWSRAGPSWPTAAVPALTKATWRQAATCRTRRASSRPSRWPTWCRRRPP